MSQFPADPKNAPADPFDELARLINGDVPEPVAPPTVHPAIEPAPSSDYDIQAAMEGRAPQPAPVMPTFDPAPSGVHQVPTRGPLAQVAARAEADASAESPLDAVFDLTALRAAFANKPLAEAESIVPQQVAAPEPAPAPIFEPMPEAEASPTDVAEVVEPPVEFAAAPAAVVEPTPAMFADMQAMMDTEAATAASTLPEASFELDLEQGLEAALMDDLAAFEPEPSAELAPISAPVEPVIATTAPVEPMTAEREYFYPPARNGKRRAMAMTAAVLIMGGTGAGIWTLLGDGQSADAPVILADVGAVKVKPADAGGAAIPNQDTALFKSEVRPHQDALKSGTEKPVEVAVADRPVKVKTQIRRALPPTARKVRTVVVKPDGTIVSGAEVVGAVAPRVAKPAAVAPKIEAEPVVRKVSTAKPTAEPVWGEAEVAVKPAPKKSVKAPEPVAKPKPQKVAKAEPVAKKSSDYVVQISSRRSPESARNAFAKLQRRYSSVLGGRSAEYQKTEIAGKGTFYRVRVLASSKSDAGELCGSLKRAGGSCFVTR